MPVSTSLVPDILIEVMKDFAKQVLREKPQNVYEFAAEYFEKLIVKRDAQLHQGYEKFESVEQYLKDIPKFLVRPTSVASKNLETKKNSKLKQVRRANRKGPSKLAEQTISEGENKGTESEGLNSCLSNEQHEAEGKSSMSLTDIQKKTDSVSCSHEKATQNATKKKSKTSLEHDTEKTLSVQGISSVEQLTKAGANGENKEESSPSQERDQSTAQNTPVKAPAGQNNSNEDSDYYKNNGVDSGGAVRMIQNDKIETENRFMTECSSKVEDTDTDEQNANEVIKSEANATSREDGCNETSSEPIVLKKVASVHGAIAVQTKITEEEHKLQTETSQDDKKSQEAHNVKMPAKGSAGNTAYKKGSTLELPQESLVDTESIIKDDTPIDKFRIAKADLRPLSGTKPEVNAEQLEDLDKILNTSQEKCSAESMTPVTDAKFAKAEEAISPKKTNKEKLTLLSSRDDHGNSETTTCLPKDGNETKLSTPTNENLHGDLESKISETVLENVPDNELEKISRPIDSHKEGDDKVELPTQSNAEKVLESYKNYLENINGMKEAGISESINYQVLQPQLDDQTVDPKSRQESLETLNGVKNSAERQANSTKGIKNNSDLQEDNGDRKVNTIRDSRTPVDENSCIVETAKESPKRLKPTGALPASGTNTVVQYIPDKSGSNANLNSSDVPRKAHGSRSTPKEHVSENHIQSPSALQQDAEKYEANTYENSMTQPDEKPRSARVMKENSQKGLQKDETLDSVVKTAAISGETCSGGDVNKNTDSRNAKSTTSPLTEDLRPQSADATPDSGTKTLVQCIPGRTSPDDDLSNSNVPQKSKNTAPHLQESLCGDHGESSPSLQHNDSKSQANINEGSIAQVAGKPLIAKTTESNPQELLAIDAVLGSSKNAAVPFLIDMNHAVGLNADLNSLNALQNTKSPVKEDLSGNYMKNPSKLQAEYDKSKPNADTVSQVEEEVCSDKMIKKNSLQSVKTDEELDGSTSIAVQSPRADNSGSEKFVQKAQPDDSELDEGLAENHIEKCPYLQQNDDKFKTDTSEKESSMTSVGEVPCNGKAARENPSELIETGTVPDHNNSKASKTVKSAGSQLKKDISENLHRCDTVDTVSDKECEANSTTTTICLSKKPSENQVNCDCEKEIHKDSCSLVNDMKLPEPPQNVANGETTDQKSRKVLENASNSSEERSDESALKFKLIDETENTTPYEFFEGRNPSVINEGRKLKEHDVSKYDDSSGSKGSTLEINSPGSLSSQISFVPSKPKLLADDKNVEQRIGTPRTFVENVSLDSENGSQSQIDLVLPDQIKLANAGNHEKISAAFFSNLEKKVSEGAKHHNSQNNLENLPKVLGNRDSDQQAASEDFEIPTSPVNSVQGSSEYMKPTWFIGADPIVTSSTEKCCATPTQIGGEPTVCTKGENLEQTEQGANGVTAYNLSENLKLAIQSVIPKHETLDTNVQDKEQSVVEELDILSKSNPDKSSILHQQEGSQKPRGKLVNALVSSEQVATAESSYRKGESTDNSPRKSSKREQGDAETDRGSVGIELNRTNRETNGSEEFSNENESDAATQEKLLYLKNTQQSNQKNTSHISASNEDGANNIYENAAVKIQTKYRNYKLTKKITAASIIQRTYRDFMTRKKIIAKADPEDQTHSQDPKEIDSTQNEEKVSKSSPIRQQLEQFKTPKQRNGMPKDGKGSVEAISHVSKHQNSMLSKFSYNDQPKSENIDINSREGESGAGTDTENNTGSSDTIIAFQQNDEPNRSKKLEMISAKTKVLPQIEPLKKTSHLDMESTPAAGIPSVLQSSQTNEVLGVPTVGLNNQETRENIKKDAPQNASPAQLSQPRIGCENGDSPKIATEPHKNVGSGDARKEVVPPASPPRDSNEVDNQSKALKDTADKIISPELESKLETKDEKYKQSPLELENNVCSAKHENSKTNIEGGEPKIEQVKNAREKRNPDMETKEILSDGSSGKEELKTKMSSQQLSTIAKNGEKEQAKTENVSVTAGQEDDFKQLEDEEIINTKTESFRSVIPKELPTDDLGGHNSNFSLEKQNKAAAKIQRKYRSYAFHGNEVNLESPSNGNSGKNERDSELDKGISNDLNGNSPPLQDAFKEEISQQFGLCQDAAATTIQRTNGQRSKDNLPPRVNDSTSIFCVEKKTKEEGLVDNSNGAVEKTSNEPDIVEDTMHTIHNTAREQGIFEDPSQAVVKKVKEQSIVRDPQQAIEKTAKKPDKTEDPEQADSKHNISRCQEKCYAHDDLTNAAVVIQKNFRGYQARKLDLQSTKRLEYFHERNKSVAGLKKDGKINANANENCSVTESLLSGSDSEKSPHLERSNHSLENCDDPFNESLNANDDSQVFSKISEEDEVSDRTSSTQVAPEKSMKVSENTGGLTNEETVSKDSLSEEDALNTIIDVRVEPKSIFQLHKCRDRSSDMTNAHDYQTSTDSVSTGGSSSSYQHPILFTDESLIARRMTLQRGDAVQGNSTPEEDNLKSCAENMLTSSNQRSMFRLGPRQRTMPVQIDSDVIRVIPKHLRKRIKSAEDFWKRKRQQIQK